MAEEPQVSISALSEERLKLEREALELERARIEAARARAEAELKMARSRHPFLVFASVTLLALLCFAGGTLLGIHLCESRIQRQRDARLREALSQLSGFADVTSATNAASTSSGSGSGASGTRGDVSVVVIQ